MYQLKVKLSLPQSFAHSNDRSCLSYNKWRMNHARYMFILACTTHTANERLFFQANHANKMFIRQRNTFFQSRVKYVKESDRVHCNHKSSFISKAYQEQGHRCIERESEAQPPPAPSPPPIRRRAAQTASCCHSKKRSPIRQHLLDELLHGGVGGWCLVHLLWLNGLLDELQRIKCVNHHK